MPVVEVTGDGACARQAAQRCFEIAAVVMGNREAEVESAALAGRFADQRRQGGVVGLDRAREVIGGEVKIADGLALLNPLLSGKVCMS
jgi:hypothetical protein